MAHSDSLDSSLCLVITRHQTRDEAHRQLHVPREGCYVQFRFNFPIYLPQLGVVVLVMQDKDMLAMD
jgi:hypothetical protein